MSTPDAALGPPTPDELQYLRSARELLRQAAEVTQEPAVYQAIHTADMNLHFACWQLGAVDEIAPQIAAGQAASDGARQ